MIFEFGTIFLLGLTSLASFSDNPSYQYKGTFINDNVIKSQYLEFSTDDDDYFGLFDLSLTFDFYFNGQQGTYYVENLTFVNTITRYYPNGSYGGQYSITLNCGSYSTVDFEDLQFKAEWSMAFEDDRCFFNLVNPNTDSVVYSGNAVIIPYSEEFIHSYGFNYLLDFSQVYNQLNDFVNNIIGYTAGYDNGYNSGYSNGVTDGSASGYQSGYTDGYTEGATQDETAVAIFSGIISVGLIPINFFLACLNFEVFGINIGAFVSALLTVAIVVIITRMIVSGGNGGDK